MTNFEAIMKCKEPRELAWILNNEGSCSSCVYQSYEFCKYEKDKGKKRLTCVDGHSQWLKREQTKQDKEAFIIAKRNNEVELLNVMMTMRNNLVNALNNKEYAEEDVPSVQAEIKDLDEMLKEKSKQIDKLKEERDNV